MGNLRSVQKTFNRMNEECIITEKIEDILVAKKLLLPGVGNFEYGMKRLEETGIQKALTKRVVEDKVPILGICLGMQLMTEFSEEGNVKGLGWIEADTKKFPSSSLKVPHMGWNTVTNKKETKLSEGISANDSFYFVHSYYVTCKRNEDQLFETRYGTDFTSGFQKDNIIGVQFHPEKSYAGGIKILQNFCSL